MNIIIAIICCILIACILGGLLTIIHNAYNDMYKRKWKAKEDE